MTRQSVLNRIDLAGLVARSSAIEGEHSNYRGEGEPVQAQDDDPDRQDQFTHQGTLSHHDWPVQTSQSQLTHA